MIVGIGNQIKNAYNAITNLGTAICSIINNIKKFFNQINNLKESLQKNENDLALTQKKDES